MVQFTTEFMLQFYGIASISVSLFGSTYFILLNNRLLNDLLCRGLNEHIQISAFSSWFFVWWSFQHNNFLTVPFWVVFICEVYGLTVFYLLIANKLMRAKSSMHIGQIRTRKFHVPGKWAFVFVCNHLCVCAHESEWIIVPVNGHLFTCICLCGHLGMHVWLSFGSLDYSV